MSDNPSSLPPGYEPPSFNTCDDVNERCPVEATIYGDYFTSGACIFFVAIYGLLLMGQSYLGFRARTWSFSIWLNIGIISELMGYSGRLVMSYNPWIYDAFCIQLVMLILGPTFVAASISITFKHLTLWYGPEWSLLKPKLYPWVFVGSDLFSIVIQAAGGIVSAMATSEDTDQHLLDIGGDLLVAGVVFQAANMIICGGLMVVYIVRRKRSLRHGPERMHSSAGPEAGEPWAVAAVAKHGKGQRDPAAERKVKTFIWAITFAYVAIIIRCIYR